MFRWLEVFRRRRPRNEEREANLFQDKYENFKELLQANNRALEIIADLESTVYQDKPFSFLHIVSQAEALSVEVDAIVRRLNALSGGRYAELAQVSRRIAEAVLSELLRKRRFEDTGFVQPLERLSLENVQEVGGKAAGLGEIANRVHLPVPPGFAITAYAFQLFLDYNDLSDFIPRHLAKVDLDDTEALSRAAEEVQERILQAELPADLAQAIRQAARDLAERCGGTVRLAVRSSATSEDSEASFAGQHATVLNVSEEGLERAYRDVVASLYSPRAIYYRRRRGYREQDVAMSVACIVMVPAAVSGVLYTRDPHAPQSDAMLLSAVWGLAADAVEGAAATDFYEIDRRERRVRVRQVARKETRLRLDPQGGVREEAVPAERQEAPCLNDEQIGRLVDYGLKLEAHYGVPLDIEWAIDEADRVFLLQARPLARRQATRPAESERPAVEVDPVRHPVLIAGGQTASEGTAAGAAYVLQSDHTLHHVPEGAIVVTRQTSPRFVPLMGRVRAFVTEVGSVTGHMASVAREFRVPALVGVVGATEAIPHGEEITVDATRRVVYRGRVDALLAAPAPVNPMRGSPAYQLVKSVLRRIAPLHLTDPQSDQFTPAGCRTMHDVIRFAHEMAMQEMFRLGDQLDPGAIQAVPVRAGLPFRILAVDLGNGLRADRRGTAAEIEEVTSIPFRALLQGMRHEAVDWSQNVGFSWSGLASIVAQTAIRDPLREVRMGEPSYALIGGRYLNFNARIGYHFTTIDSFCSREVNDNYILFYFKGGAADLGRRTRRALLIAQILKRLGFKVEQKGDLVRGELKKYEEAAILERLDRIGRLLGAVRLLDMHLAEDRQVEWYVEEFFRGNYRFLEERTA